MLIKALSDYYALLNAEGELPSEGYSKVGIHYLICLDADGTIEELVDYKVKKELSTAGGKTKEKWVPRGVQMPQRTEKPGIDSNIIEHRPVYIFGLNYENEILTPKDSTNKACKSHDVFVKVNLEFLEGLDSPLIRAYRNFLLKWKPEEEIKNEKLLQLGKEYGKSGFAFCLAGQPDKLLHEEMMVKAKWEKLYRSGFESEEDVYISQCAISGKKSAIARLHNKIKGVYGGNPTGSILIGFNNPSESSYGKEQSYNSNISQEVMMCYTKALNYLLDDSTQKKHKIALDDVTVVFWAMNMKGTCEDSFMAMLYGRSEMMDEKETEDMLRSLLESGRKGNVLESRLQSLGMIDSDVDFYMLGLKPNSARLSVKFVYRKKYAELLWNIARFQKELQMSEDLKPISIERIKKELISPKSSSEKINPSLISKLFESVVYGNRYPMALLETIVRRVRTDGDKEFNRIRAGVIKACLNRNYIKEEFGMALDKGNMGQAYLCGRLFAVLERLQQDASNGKLNRTIKDAYFASASSKPVTVFPKLLKLAQNHLNKVDVPIQVRHSKLIGEIMDKINGEFPETLLLSDQGRFMIGYYQQRQDFFKKNQDNETAKMEIGE